MALFSYSSIIYLIIGIAVLLLILYNQRRIRQVYRKMRIRIPIILGIIGIITLSNYLMTETLTLSSIISTIISLTVLAIGMGIIRAKTIKLWGDNGNIFRQGTWVTIGLWLITFGLHLFLDFYGNTGESTLLIYYAITLIVQRWVIQRRVNKDFSNLMTS